ncbi:MAG: FecR family protein [Pseudomonadota bacterium]
MTSDFRVKISAFDKRTLRPLAVAALLFAQAAFAQGAIADEIKPGVGTVGLVLGKAYLESADNSRERIRAGTRISVSDRIVTEANGHVHIQFDDEAMVSVRPDSLLEIERYDYNAASPEQSSIKLNLVEGVTRSISGNGARAARERFRLNTPIAAIGVRGTDFVVSATGESVRALVNEGAIVVAPFSNDCLASNFGPCALNAVELTEESLQIVQMDGGTPLPRLMAVADAPGTLAPTTAAAADSGKKTESKAVGTDVYLESVTSRKVTLVASNTVVTPPVIPRPPTLATEDFTPDIAMAASDVASEQLVWGRWTEGRGALERITVDKEQAAAGRTATVGSSLPVGFGVEYLLYRTDNGRERPDSNLSTVSFALSSAQAFYVSPAGYLPMQVNSGTLSIDFNQSTFATQLGLSHNLTGAVDFSAAGRLEDAGNFYSNTDTQKMAGAVSLDGTDAGYFFEKQVLDGNVQGLTLWDKQ